MTKLLIVESPAKAKTISKYLGKDYEVIASYGHVRDLPSKEGSVDPNNDFAIIYVNNDAKHVNNIKKKAKEADEILLATDPDREGEAISWHIENILNETKVANKKPCYRVVFNEITKNAVKNAVKNPRQIDMNLVNAQQARRALDYLVGFNLSPLLWRKLPGSRSAGRVQSLALRLICEREYEIEQFISQEYWQIKCDFSKQNYNFSASLFQINEQKLDKFHFNSEEQVKPVVKEMAGREFAVKEVTKKEVRRNPKPPFTTSTLQQEASKKLGLSTKLTMQIAQKLYEGIEVNGENIGLITYMRTDGVQVSDQALKNSREFIGNTFGEDYLPEKSRIYANKSKNAQEAHEAIRPTDVSLSPEKIKPFLNDLQFKLYNLIWLRMVASQMSSAIIHITTVIISDKEHKYYLKLSGSIIKFDGFYKLYRDDESDDENLLPPIVENDLLELLKVNPSQHFTEPKPRYNEASLVKKMEELGIGRPSTYSSIISVLQDRDYVRMENKKFVPENRGLLVTAFLTNYFKKYVEYDFTAKLEQGLDEVAEGTINWKKLLADFWLSFNENVENTYVYKIEDVLDSIEKTMENHLFRPSEENPDPRKCPKCENGTLKLRTGKYGPFISCSNYPECNYITNIIKNDNGEDGNVENKFPIILGYNQDNKMISIRKGPYGTYVQLGDEVKDDKKSIVRTSIPKQLNYEQINLEEAQKLLSLPLIIAKHPDNDQDISLNIGRYGPYLSYNGKFISLAREKDILNIDPSRAIDLAKISDSKVPRAKKVLKQLGDYEIIQGGFGIKYLAKGEVKIKLDKKVSIEDLTIKEVEKIFSKKQKK